jgi:hypothetical protein
MTAEREGVLGSFDTLRVFLKMKFLNSGFKMVLFVQSST